MKRLFASITAAFLALLPMLASAEAYPSKPIKFVVGFPPGGGNDILARLIGQKLSEMWGQPVVVDNKPGANAIIATEFVAKAPPDGYTFYVGASGAMTFNPGLYDKLPYDPVKDFVAITPIASFPLVLAVHPSVAAKSVGEFVKLAKAQPGKLNYASGSTPFRVATELFRQQAGIDVQHIPYKGSAQSITATVAGQTQLVTVDLPPALEQIKAGRLTGLAVTGPKRTSIAPDLPTMAEAGMPEYSVELWSGLFAPAGTSAEIVNKVHAAVAQVLRMDDVKARLAGLGYDAGGTPPAEFAAVLKSDLAKWTKVAREAQIKAE